MPDQLPTPEIMKARGSRDFDLGRSVDDHHMNPSALALKDWLAGWYSAWAAAVHADLNQSELLRGGRVDARQGVV